MLIKLNKMVEKIESLEERIFSEENPISETEINEFGFIMVKNYELLGYYGIAITGLFLLDLNKPNYVPMIVVDGDYMELSDNAKRFIIAHELGHYLKHVKRFSKPDYTRDINDEYEADEYSANIVGLQSAVFALEELQDKLDEISCGMNKMGIDEIEKRIENLMSKATINC